MTDQDPVVVIKVTFDELPEDAKHNIHIFMGIAITCLILTNVMLISKLIKFYYFTFKSNRQINSYEPV